MQMATAWLVEVHAPPHMCYHAEFGHSALKDVGINTGEPQKIGGAWNSTLLIWDGIDVADPTPRRVTTSNLVVLRQRVYA